MKMIEALTNFVGSVSPETAEEIRLKIQSLDQEKNDQILSQSINIHLQSLTRQENDGQLSSKLARIFEESILKSMLVSIKNHPNFSSTTHLQVNESQVINQEGVIQDLSEDLDVFTLENIVEYSQMFSENK